jgi:hypothetical protein
MAEPLVELKEFRRWYTELRINGFVDYVHRPEFWITNKNTSIREMDLFPSSGEGRETSKLCFVAV